ncbi:MAG TPA: glycosyltransferase family 39 protein, partial [Polyangia bacterium]|nr:glycosyltransferase family 39 protein [Polyangia bacterium]
VYDTDDHPPMGKLIIAGVMRVVGDDPVGWRLASELFGFINIGLGAWQAWVVFRRRRAALIAAAFVAADGFFIAYARAALLDGMIVAFALAGFTTLLAARRSWHVLLAAALLGGAASFKLNGVPFVAAATVLCAASRRWRRLAPLVLLTAALVFYLQSAAALVLTGRSGTLTAVIAENHKLVTRHLSYTVVHPYSSKWYTWFVPTRPIFLRHDVDPTNGTLRASLTLGNPLLWWASSLAIVVAATVVAKVGLRRLWAQLQAMGSARIADSPVANDAVLALDDRAALLFAVLAAWLGPLAFWVPSLRDAYLYHYFPSYAFALILLAGLTERCYAKPRCQAWTFVAILLVAEASFFYAPLWGELPIAQAAVRLRLPFGN